MLSIMLTPAAATVIAQPVSYASTGSPCGPLSLLVPGGVTCPTRIEQAGTLDVAGCAGPEPATCTVTAQGSATSRAAPIAPREVHLLLQSASGGAPDAYLCDASATAAADTVLACSGSASLSVPLSLGACTELRAHAEMAYVVGEARALMSQTEIAYRLCRAATGELSLARA